MSKQARVLRYRERVKSIVSVDNAVKKPVTRQSALYEGRFIVRSNHAKVGVQHFSV